MLGLVVVGESVLGVCIEGLFALGEYFVGELEVGELLLKLEVGPEVDILIGEPFGLTATGGALLGLIVV